ncbi:MAG: gliding motility-associated C-terminal domain-containing protein [Flavobacteriales bacterium]|nr:gliding motility-associated C-terminal domain-containing protein [Flavobacteriales bacterium]
MLSVRACLFCLILAPSVSFAQEVCNNGTDDDGDGAIDLNDPDCPCSTAIFPANVESYIPNHSFEEQVPGPNGPCCPYDFVSPFSPPWLSCAEGWYQATSATSDYFHECGYSPIGMPLPPPDGQGAVGFFDAPGYFEYVGSCLTNASPPQPMLGGTTYTLSLWIAAVASSDNHQQSVEHSDPSVFVEQMPLAIFGYANACVPFPIPTMDCAGYLPGWVEMGRVMVQPAREWTRVSITFTPTEDIHSVIIGGACDVPASFGGQWVTDSQGVSVLGGAYFLVDDLMLTQASDQVLTPVSTSGTICQENASALAVPPVGATAHQWYRDGVAIPGQTALELDISGLGLEGGRYTLASTFEGQCLMGAATLPMGTEPRAWPSIEPSFGCAPLEVLFTDTSANVVSSRWTFGDGAAGEEEVELHTYAQPGSYDVTLTVTDMMGCEGDTLLVDAVIVGGPLQAVINATPNPTDTENTTVELNGANSQGDIISWWWDLGDVSPGFSSNSSLVVDFPAVEGTYPVLLAVESSAGCVDTVRSVIVVTVFGRIDMPNVFSPNGDGHNDRFIPLDHTGAPGSLEIFNRWGQLVFSTKSLAQGWSGSEVPDGTYYYVVTPDDPDADKLSGHVTLVR